MSVEAQEAMRALRCARTGCTGVIGMMTQSEYDARQGREHCANCAPVMSGQVRARDMRDGENAPDEDTEDQRPRCSGCGSMDFRIYVERTDTWYGVEMETDNTIAYFDPGEVVDHRVVCDDCGRNVTHEIDWDCA